MQPPALSQKEASMNRRLDFSNHYFLLLLLTIFHSQDTYAYDWNIL